MRTAVLLALEGGLGLFALVLGALVGVDPLRTFHLTAAGLTIGALGAVPMFLLFALLWKSRARALERIRVRVEEAVKSLFAEASWPTLAALSIAAGLGEEMLFRGLLQGGLEPVLGAFPALLIASLAFGLVHPVSPAYVALAALLGLYLGVLWSATDNLVVPAAAHAVYDFVALTAILGRLRTDARERVA